MTPKKVVNNAFAVSSNNESQFFPSKNTAFLDSSAYKSSFNLITLLITCILFVLGQFLYGFSRLDY